MSDGEMAHVEGTPQSVIAERLTMITGALERTLQAPEQAKSYHRLRVAIRRARVVLQLLRHCNSALKTKKLKSVLRELFTTAGQVRRFDVALASLQDQRLQADELMQAALEVSIVWLAEERSHAIRVHQRCAEKHQRKVGRLVSRLVTSMGLSDPQVQSGEACNQAAPSGWTVTNEFHVPALRLLCTRADAVRRAAQEDLHSANNLHQLRIQCKKLRYGLEAVKIGFRFDAPMESLLERMTALQDRLGAINDAHELALMLDEHALRFQQAESLATPAVPAVLRGKLEELAHAKRIESEEGLQQFLAEWRGGGKQLLLSELEAFPLLPTAPQIETFKPTIVSARQPAPGLAS